MLAIELTSQQMNIINASVSGSNIQVKRSYVVPMPSEGIKNGTIDMQKVVADKIKEFFFENGIKEKKVCFSIESTLVKSKRMKIPYVDEKRTLDFIRHEMGSIISEERFIIDYVIHKMYKEGKKAMIDTTAYVIPVDVFERYVQLSKEMGWKIVRFDILNDSLEKQIHCDKKLRTIKGFVDVPEQPSWTKKVWFGVYDERFKIATRDVYGKLSFRTIMAGLPEYLSPEELDEEMMKRCISELQQHIVMQENMDEENLIEEIEVFGEYKGIGKLPKIISEVFEIRAGLIQMPKNVKGIDQNAYPIFVGTIGSLITDRR